MNTIITIDQSTLQLPKEKAPIAKQESVNFYEDEELTSCMAQSHTMNKSNMFSQKIYATSPNADETITWLRDKRGHGNEWKRWNVIELVQQDASSHYGNSAIDEDSLLVRVECRKSGCRCVLKNESALAMKIVSGVSLVQGTCISNHTNMNLLSNSSGMSSFGDEFSPSNVVKTPNKSSWLECRSTSQISIASASSERNPCAKSGLSSKGTPLILTSCCPSWFELVQRTPMTPLDNGPTVGAPLPVWTSGKSLWKAKPGLVLVRKETKCLLSCTIDMSASVMSHHSSNVDNQNQPTLDADRWKILRPGTVLLVLDCKLCQLFHSGGCSSAGSNSGSSNTSGTLHLSKNRLRTASMLQCSIIGAKSIQKVLQNSNISNARLNDALASISDTNIHVYLPLDDKTVAFSPVALSPMLSGQIKNPSGVNKWFGNGVHSLLSLLVNFRLPVLVKPVFGRSLADWIPNQSANNSSSIHSNLEPNSNNSAQLASTSSSANCFLKLSASYHGTLIFLEPINDCNDSQTDGESTKSGTNVNSSRFFVVTMDMLAQHKFLIADSASRSRHSRKLKAHACRVAHFLAACHPLYGIAYLLRYMEETSQYSTTGPPHNPLSRTLGPPGAGPNNVASLSAIASIAAIAAIASGDLDLVGQLTRTNGGKPEKVTDFDAHTVSKTAMHEILNEIDDIYCYVRTGRFPESSKFFNANMQANKHRSRSVIGHEDEILKHNVVMGCYANPNTVTNQVVSLSRLNNANIGKIQTTTANKHQHLRQKSAELKSSFSHCLPMFLSSSTQQFLNKNGENCSKEMTTSNTNTVNTKILNTNQAQLNSRRLSQNYFNLSVQPQVTRQSTSNMIMKQNVKLSPVNRNSQINYSHAVNDGTIRSRSNIRCQYPQHGVTSPICCANNLQLTSTHGGTKSPLAANVSGEQQNQQQTISRSAFVSSPILNDGSDNLKSALLSPNLSNQYHVYDKQLVFLQPATNGIATFNTMQNNLLTENQYSKIMVSNASLHQPNRPLVEFVPVTFANGASEGAAFTEASLHSPNKPVHSQYAEVINSAAGHGSTPNLVCHADTIGRSITESMTAEVNHSLGSTPYKNSRRLDSAGTISGASSIGSITGHTGQHISNMINSPLIDPASRQLKTLSPASKELAFENPYRPKQNYLITNSTPLPLMQPHLNFEGFKHYLCKYPVSQAQHINLNNSQNQTRIGERTNSSPDTGFGAESVVQNIGGKNSNCIWTPQVKKPQNASQNIGNEANLSSNVSASPSNGTILNAKTQRMYIL